MTTRAVWYLLVCLCAAGTAGATPIERSFTFESPTIARTAEGVRLEVPRCVTIGFPGEPALPVFAACFLLPPGEAVAAVRFEAPETVSLLGAFEVAPARYQQPTGRDAPTRTIRNETVYGSPDPYPAATGALVTEQVWCGMRVAFIDVYPCRLVPKTGALTFSPTVTVTVETRSLLEAPAPSAPRTREKALRSLERIAANAAAVRDYERGRAGASAASGDDAVPYVIITSRQLMAAFQPLADLRTALGLRAKIVGLDSITAAFGGADTQERIRSFIAYAHAAWQTEYVLLGGDDEIIPHRGFYVKAGTEIETDIPSDLYYAALDGNWNTDGDAYFGEPGEEDLLPEVIVGRAPVDSEAEVDHFVSKVLAYTTSPPPLQCTEALMVGEHLSSNGGIDTWGGDYKDEIRFGSSNYGFSTAAFPASFDCATLYDRDLGYAWTAVQLLSFLNAGVNLVNHLGHTSLHGVMRLSVNDVAMLTNTVPETIAFVCYSQGCYPAAFDNRDDAGTIHEQDAIGEELVSGPAGAVAFIGNSRLGWYDPGSTCGVSQFFDRRFFDAIFNEGITALGDALNDSRIDNISYLPYPAVRYVMYELTLLGDPALRVWTAEPASLTVVADSVLDTDQETYTVEVHDGAGPVADARVTLSGEQPALYRTASTDEWGIAYLQTGTLESGAVLLSVNARDHYPFSDSIPVAAVSTALPRIVYISAGGNFFGSGGAGTIGSGGWFNLDIALENAGTHTATGTEVNLTHSDSFVSIIDGTCTLGDVPPHTNLIKENAFIISIEEGIPAGHPVSLDFDIVSLEGRWSTQQTLVVVGPAITLESWSVSDVPHGNGNGCLEGWEFLDLSCTWRNSGSVDITNAIITLIFPPGSWARVTDKQAIVASLPAGGSVVLDDELGFFVKEQTPPLSEITMYLSFSSSVLPSHFDTIAVRTCGYGYDDAVDPPGLWEHHAVIGMDGWHRSGERAHSGSESWKCGGGPSQPYANMMDAVLVSPPLCLYQNSRLTFYHWIEAEATTLYPYWAEDAGVVEVSTDGGATWSIVAPIGNYPARASANNTIFLNPYQRCYSASFDWDYEEFDLSAFSGPVLLRFHFATNEQYPFEGWYIDDVSVTTEMVTPVDDDTPAASRVTALRPARPNPFNPATVIPFETAAPGRVTLMIYDVSGRRVRTLVDRTLPAGAHEAAWDGSNDRGSHVASGVYLCTLRTGTYSATQRLVLVR